ncbi:ferrooxidoreductase Fet3 [Sporothrix brasiliensis 5110]|uniref:Ferrooxidoreductase Fet3 n=1 Tax=Sporothrix brasiliensis 5110 TaxID=1398154 RepID=A0A0C2IWV9_9PEZI|nr:ferrooxidoreductase Fet3 [Sporothrix brasiliensis 5110]KIH89512.1 ferrooxidoreductase Fet3 [Sporothrix brasiliensis 5110]
MARFSLLPALASVLLASRTLAATVTVNWDITWVNAAPDGFSRPVIGINGAWPCPTLEANAGDIIQLTINNQLGNETTGLHFHGIDQVQTPWMDGPSGVTQCPVPPGSSVTYTFVANAPGTYWYHSHNMGQYPDGLRGPFIVHDPNDPYAGKYDEEIVLTVSDWYHDQSITLVQNMLESSNTQFLPPFPDGIVVNEGRGANISFANNKTYRLRIISFAAFASTLLHFDSHTMQVIMADASYVKQAQAYQLRIAPAQRYDVLISGVARDHRNYPFLLSLDINRDFANDPPQAVVWPHNATGYLVMDPSGAFPQDVVSLWQPVDDVSLRALDGAAAYGPVAQTITLNFDFCTDANGLPRACFNGQPYIAQKVPTLYSVATTGANNTNPAVYGDVNPFVLATGSVVTVVVNNLDTAIHPFHMHGHQFQVLDRPASNAGVWGGHNRTFPASPMRRDTISVNPNSYAVLRIQITNPGVFLFHCHIEWHVEMGLTATLIQSPELLRNASFPQDHIDNCIKQGIPYQGNAAGNTQDVLDTSDFLTVPPTTYTGALYSAATDCPAPLRARRVRRHLD